MKEEIELTDAFVDWVKRLVRLESQIDDLYRDRTSERQFVSVDQIDELTTKVEQNMTRKLRQRMGERP